MRPPRIGEGTWLRHVLGRGGCRSLPCSASGAESVSISRCEHLHFFHLGTLAAGGYRTRLMVVIAFSVLQGLFLSCLPSPLPSPISLPSLLQFWITLWNLAVAF